MCDVHRVSALLGVCVCVRWYVGEFPLRRGEMMARVLVSSAGKSIV